jgi:tetratricopeptide (TPR) repeat protein
MRLGNRESAVTALAEAQRLLTAGTTEEYLAFTERAVTRFPRDPALRLEYAAALCHAGRDEAPAEALRAVGLDEAGDPARLTRAANLLVHLGEVEAARACADRAAQARPTNVVIVNRLAATRGLIAARQGDYESAEAFLRAAHEADPTDAFAARDLALVIARDGASPIRFAEALAVIDRTLTRTPASQGEADGLARGILRQARERINEELDEVDRDPDPPGAAPGGDDALLADTLAQARELLGRGASEEYLAYTERAAARFPRSAAVRLEYATAVGAFDPERARAEALEIAALEFDHELERAALLVRAARLLLDLGDPAGASLLAARAAEPAPSFVMIVNELTGLQGAIAAAIGDDATGESELRAAHAADPIHSVFARDLAEFLLARGRPEEALAVIERTLATPERPGIFQSRAGCVLERLREQITS